MTAGRCTKRCARLEKLARAFRSKRPPTKSPPQRARSPRPDPIENCWPLSAKLFSAQQSNGGKCAEAKQQQPAFDAPVCTGAGVTGAGVTGAGAGAGVVPTCGDHLRSHQMLHKLQCIQTLHCKQTPSCPHQHLEVGQLGH